MKTAYTVIIQVNGLGTIAEIEQSVEGIKLAAKGIVIPMVIDPSANPTSSAWQDYFSHDELLTASTKTIREIESDNIGVYVVSHGGPGSVGGLKPEGLANLINEIGFPSIRKLSIVACNVSLQLDPTKNDIPESKFQATADQSYVGELCKKISPLTPMIASYMGYVSVLSPTSVGSVYKNTSGNASYKGIDLEALKNKGRKVQKVTHIQGRNSLMSMPGAREKVKIVLQLKSGQVSLIPLAEWHDA
ncbi:MAG: hypothetical protein V4488_06780 [Pseudomonadota bacterium]